jgi:hypothetical protein
MKTPRTRKTAAQRRAEEQASTFGILPAPTPEQLAKDDPRNDPRVIAVLAAWAVDG